MAKYITELNRDVVAEVIDLTDRISKLERNPRLTRTAIDHGSLIVNIDGQIVVGGTEGERIVIAYFTDIASTVVLATPDTASSTSNIIMEVSDITLDTVDQTFFNMYSMNIAASSIWGGIFEMLQTLALMAWVENGVVTSFFAFRKFSTFGITGNIYTQGRWLDNQQLSTKEAILSGALSVGAGVSTATITYAQSYATTMYAIPTLHSASGAVNWSVTAQSAASFTVSWIGTTAKIINFWNIRM